MKSLKMFVAVLSLSSSVAFAVEPTPFFKVGVGLIINKTNDIGEHADADRQVLYGDSKYTYQIETGISVPTDTNDEFRLGLHWSDLLQQKEFTNIHRPYKLEVFSDYVFKLENNYFVKVGAGFKVLYDEEIKYTVNNEVYTYRFTNYLDKLTARIAIGKTFGKYELAIEHHSQWLRGKPVDTEWEYQATTLNINYKF